MFSPNLLKIDFGTYFSTPLISHTNGTEKAIVTPEWDSGLDYRKLTWAPDGQKIVFSNATHVIVTNLAGISQEVLAIENPTVFFDWYGSNRILVRDLYTPNFWDDETTRWNMDIWSVDLNNLESPVLIAEKIESPVMSSFIWSQSGQFNECIMNGTNDMISKSPFLENGHFIAGVERIEINNQRTQYSNIITCDIDGNCQYSDLYHGTPYYTSSLTPDGGKLVFNDQYNFTQIFDREKKETDIFTFTHPLPDNIKLPSHYKIWPPTENYYTEDKRLKVFNWNWLDNETFLAFLYTPIGSFRDRYSKHKYDLITFNINNGTKTKIYGHNYTESIFNINTKQLSVSPSKKYITLPIKESDLGIRILGSLLNLTADLQPNKTTYAVNLQGIATDLNLSSWSLEYADQKTPDQWRVIVPHSENPVVNSSLATWIPPHEGSFLVRLTVKDKAGNTAWDRKVVTWGKQFSVTNIYKTGELFSPNDDGVKETVGLNYLVHEPVHLELYVYNEAGSLIKTFNQDHALPGEYGIIWDGRDESGGIVPDGYYTIRIFDYEFYFQVDTTPPDARLAFSSLSCAGVTTLSGLAFDKNLNFWTIYYNRNENPDEWYAFKTGEHHLGDMVQDDPENPTFDFIQNFTPESSPSISFLDNTSFRIVTEDLAGNQSVFATQHHKELLVLNKWDNDYISLKKNEQGTCISPDLLPISLLQPSTHNLKTVETLKNTISSATVQYRKNMMWYDAEQIHDPPNGVIDFHFDTSSLVPEEIAAVRVKMTDDSDIEYLSNMLTFNPPVFEASMGCIPEGSMTPALISMKVSLSESLETLKFQATSTDSGIANWKNILETKVFDGFPYQFAAKDLPDGYGYPLRFVGLGESGTKYISNTLNSAPQRCTKPPPLPPPPPHSCKTTLPISYNSKKAPCNSVGSGTATIKLSYCQLDGPKMLPDKVNYYLEENGSYRLLKQFELAVDGWGEVSIQTDDLPEGKHQVKVDLVYGESIVENFRQNILVVDRTLPEARITYPAPSAPFCAQSFDNEQGDVFHYTAIEGVADDENDIQGYSIIYGKGSHPSQWFTVGNNMPCSPENGDCSYLNTEHKHGLLGDWNVTELDSTVQSLQLMVTDTFGNTSCFITQAEIDLDMPLVTTLDTSIFSPNGDGIKDEVTVEYHVGEYAVLDISVLKENTIIQSLVSAQVISNSLDTVSWDGLNNEGAVVADGNYLIRVEARDSCGNKWQKEFNVALDNTPPTTIISFPGTGEPLDIVTEVTGTANDKHFAGYQLYAKDEASDDEPKVLNENTIFVDNGILGIWNTFGLEGNWALILSTWDHAGNTKTTKLPVSFGTRPQLIISLKAAPRIFSPNGDGKVDKSTAIYELTDTANIHIKVENDFGTTIVDESFPNTTSGNHQYQWFGLDENNKVVPDGNYKLTVTAESTTAPFVIQVETVTLITDTTAPLIDVTTPLDASYHSGTVNVQGTLSDTNLQEYSISLSGGSETHLFDTAVINGKIVFTKSLKLSDGVYEIRVDAKDSVENESSKTISFTVDKTRPRITLISPADGYFFGNEKTVVLINGSIEETNLQSYMVQYGSGTNPTQWIDLASGDNLPSDNQLATWNVGPDKNIPDGDYTIRFTATDKAGQESVAKVVIHVDNNAPDVAITVPQEQIYIKEAFDITGNVTDRNLKEYSLKLANSACETAVKWSVLRTGTQQIQNGIISPIQKLPADGPYCIQLSAVDALDNISTKSINITIDTTPPAPPVLSGSIEGISVSLEWSSNTEPDLAGYNLYRNNNKLNTVLINEPKYLNQNLVDGEYSYTVRAVDLAGLESKDSNQVVFSVDLTPPEAIIRSPKEGSLVSNYIDITGRAYSSEDFKEYRVSYGIGDNPQSWQLLRKSPVPVPHGLLVRWDVLSLEDGLYSIKLETKDLDGNVNKNVVTVKVDNTSPAAPVLLSASADSTTVNLNWNANDEPDLAGYLVYRNGQLTNESGTVIGDLTPYLITELELTDVDVPDGTHSYYLIAMDNIGNMSGQSNSIQVEIDTHAPHLDLVSPTSGLTFDQPIPVIAESEDTDIDMVKFQYRSTGETDWTDLGSTLTRVPYVVNLDPISLDWEYGTYRLRAVATDMGGLTDDFPEEVEIHFKDITPPAAPTGIAAKVNGGFVSLSWNQRQEEDLAGYNVYLGTSTVKRNSLLLSDISFIDPTDFAVGEYDFSVTATDTSGNESEKTPAVVAKIFSPTLQQPQPQLVSVSDFTLTGNTKPEATVEIFRGPASGSASLGTPKSDVNGGFTYAITLTEGDHNFYAVATDQTGNISRPSNSIKVTFDIPPEPPTGLQAEVDSDKVYLSWIAGPETDIVGYNIYRTTTSDWQKINTNPVTINSYTDSGLQNASYTYRVTAVDAVKNESNPSNESTATVEQQLPTPPSNLTATAPPEGGIIDLCWTISVDPVDGYLVYRSLISDGPYTQVTSSVIQDSCYQDHELTNGTKYFYIVRAIDSFNNESRDSNEVSAVPQDTISPDKPAILLPTKSGKPYQCPEDQADVSGLTEADVTVDLIRDQVWVDTVETLNEPVQETFNIDNSYLYGAIAVPFSNNVFYLQRLRSNADRTYYYQTSRKNLETGVVTSIEEIPKDSKNLIVSPDGTKLAYLYEDNMALTKIGIYDITSGVATRLTAGIEGKERDPSWSRDSTKIVFASETDDGFKDILMHDLTSGVTTRVTMNIDAYSPKISYDGKLISFLNQDPVDKQKYLYLVDADGVSPPIQINNYYINSFSNYTPPVEWSPQANKLAFLASHEGADDLYVLDTETDEIIQLTDTESIEKSLQWSPDGKYISYYFDSYSEWKSEIRMISADGEAESQLLQPFPKKWFIRDFKWLPSGIYYANSVYLQKIIPAGTFIFQDVGLHVGQNIFTVTAEDSAGNISLPADEIVVNLDAEVLPDLGALGQDIYFLPGAPLAGEEVTIDAVVRNSSSVPAENVYAEIYIWNKNGADIELIHSETIPFLDQHSEEWISCDWDSTGMVGTNTFYVLLDPKNEISETDEENNFAYSDLYVADQVGINFETTLNGTGFLSDEIISIDVNLHNSGSAANVHLTVTVEDETGVPVDELAALDKELPYGSNETLELNWTAGTVLAGKYQVRTVLVDTATDITEEQITPFTVLPDIDVSASLTTNKAEYGPDNNVLIDLSVSNLGDNIILPELSVKLTISGNDTVDYLDEQTIRNLFPKDSAKLNFSWNTARHAPGSYTASVEIYLDDELVAGNSTEFIIIPVSDISGAIAVSPKLIFQNGKVAVAYTITDSGNVAPGPVLLQLLVLDTSDWTTASSHEETITPDSNDTVSGQHEFAETWDIGLYQVILKSTRQGETKNLASDSFTVRDGIAPVVTVLSPVDGSVVSETVTLAATAIDDSSGVAKVEYQIDTGSWFPLPLVNPETGKYSRRWLPEEDDEGPHTISFRATDLAGNTSIPVTNIISIQPLVKITTTTDKPSYGMNEDVAVNIDLANIAWQKHVHLAVQVETGHGTVIKKLTDEDMILSADERKLLNFSWNTSAFDAGTYNVRSTVMKNGSVLTENLVPFVVEKVIALSGTLNLSAPSVPLGTLVKADWTVKNNGNFNVDTLNIENILSDQSAKLQTWLETVSLNKGQTVSGNFQILPQTITLGTYNLVLKAAYKSEDFTLASRQLEVVDVTPPVVSIISPEDGTIVNGPIELVVSATDDAAGVDIIEYGIDQTDWQPLSLTHTTGNTYATLWTPAETDEGNRTISFRGRDKSGNISDPVAIGVMVELCKPFEEVTGSLDISPKPLYYSQQISLQSTLTNQCNKPLDDLDIRLVIQDSATNSIVFEETVTSYIAPKASFTDNFEISSLELNVQRYQVQLDIYQPGKERRIVTESSFEILQAIETENLLFDQTNLLVWLNNGHDVCNDNSDKEDTKESKHHSKDCTKGCASYSRLENIFTQAADNYMIVCSRDDFEFELRNPFHTDIMIIGDQHQLTDHHDEELRELVHSGTGLISFGWNVPGEKSQEEGRWPDNLKQSLLGITAKGILSKFGGVVTLEDSPVSNAGELPINEQLIRVESADDAQVIGSILDECHSKNRVNDNCVYPALVMHEYGLGRTLYGAFDLCGAFNEVNIDQLTNLLVTTIGFVHREEDSPDLVPYQIKPFALEFTSPGLDFDVMVNTSCPEETILFNPALDDWVEEYPWEVKFPVLAGEKAILPYYLLPPDKEGTFRCEINTGFVDNNQFTLLNQFMYDFEVRKDRASRLKETIEAIGELDVSYRERSMKKNAQQFLQNVLDQTPTTCKQTEQNIHDIEKTINSLFKIESVDTSDIRLQLDIILRVEQGRCYFYE